MRRVPRLSVLKKRSAFLEVAANGKKWVTPGVIVQVKPRISEADEHGPTRRYGLTASKRVGSAVLRNRARRRLRSLAQEILSEHSLPNYDYVLIARPSTITRESSALRHDLITALKRLQVWQEETS